MGKLGDGVWILGWKSWGDGVEDAGVWKPFLYAVPLSEK